MKINEDFVPSTIKAAVDHLVESAEPADIEFADNDENQGYMTHHHFGRFIRNGWSLWENDSPLKRDAVENYKIAHADDISGLIIDWTVARLRGEPFEPIEACQSYYDHWKQYGTDALKAGGWEE